MSRPYADYPKEDLLKLKEEYKRAPGQFGPINAELKQRELEDNIKKLTKPHWTLLPTFWLVLISTIAVLFQVWQSVSPIVKPLIQTAPSVQSAPPLQSTGTGTAKTSQPKHVQKKT